MNFYTNDGLPPIGSTWTGAGDHEGHTVTQIEFWRPRISGASVSFEVGETPPALKEPATVEFDETGWYRIVAADETVISFDGRKIRVDGGVLTCGRVRCSCTNEWDTGGVPKEWRVPGLS